LPFDKASALKELEHAEVCCTRPHLCPPCGKVDMPGQSLAYVYGRESRADADTATHNGRGSTHREQHRQAALIAETAIGCRINYSE